MARISAHLLKVAAHGPRDIMSEGGRALDGDRAPGGDGVRQLNKRGELHARKLLRPLFKFLAWRFRRWLL